MMNLMRLLMTVVPSLWTGLYARTAQTRPATVFLVAFAAAVAHSEVAVPLLWPGSEASKGASEEAAAANEQTPPSPPPRQR